jgi:ABC-2 type transport system ATP-binding protein
MRQRLGLAQALIHRPPVLFLDEPTSAMDPAGRKDVLELIGRLRGNTTIFLSSHILSDVERVCDTIGVIHKGQLLLVSDRDELLSKYASDAVVLSFESRQTSSLMALVSKLEQQAWLTGVSLEQDDLRLAVNDVDRAKRELLPLIIDSRLILTRYEWVSPTLEDVFLSISA